VRLQFHPPQFPPPAATFNRRQHLYPFIEEQRVRLAPEVDRLIRFPVQTTFGTVDRALDLEIGQLVYFLRGRRVPNQTWDQLITLRNMRHHLAHLRPVPHRDLLSPEFPRLVRPS
jgi:hypothetical protein